MTTETPADPFADHGPREVVPNQSYFAKQMQIKITAALVPLLQDLGCNVVNPDESAPWDRATRYVRPGTGWRKGDMIVECWQRPDVQTGRSTIRFASPRWEPGVGEIKKGEARIAEKFDLQLNEDAEIITNDTNQVVHVAYEKSISLTNSYGTHVTKGMSMDLTESAEATSETTISGEYAGVSAEQKLAITVGVEATQSQSQEREEEKAREGTREDSLAVEFDVLPHTSVAMTPGAQQENQYQPVDIDNALDFDFVFHMNPEHSKHGQGYRLSKDDVTVIGVSGLLQLVHGYDTDHPGMDGYWESAPERVKLGIAYVEDPQSRRIQISTVNEAEVQTKGGYNITELGSTVPAELANLPVRNAEDL